MEIREASIEQIPAIQKLAQEIWPVAYKDILSSAQLTYMLDKFYSVHSLEQQYKDGHHFIIAYDSVYDSILPAGFASYSRKQKASPVFRLHKLYVLSRQQGKGTGKALLDHVIDKIKKEGASVLELNVNRNNPAQYFYHKNGFTITKEEDIDIGNGYFMNDFVMERKVSL